MTTHNIEYFLNQMTADMNVSEYQLLLDVGRCQIRLNSNSSDLIELLKRYFSMSVVDEPPSSDKKLLEMTLVQRDAYSPEVRFSDWKREPEKQGKKDSFYDFPGGRLLRKVRTGMMFLQSASHRVAAGPCLDYDNQVINFICTQYMAWLQYQGWLTCHAAALVHGGSALAIAGFSGGGKSTLMLHMMENPEMLFLSNDRLFLGRENEQALVAGVPKLPRVNPGTIVHNKRLHRLLSENERKIFLSMPEEELWNHEEKFDVIIDDAYGKNRIAQEAPLKSFVVLNWERGSEQALELNRVDIYERLDLLKAIMKSPGPFFQNLDGSFDQESRKFDTDGYLAFLDGVDVYEASGCVDFKALTRLCMKKAFGVESES